MAADETMANERGETWTVSTTSDKMTDRLLHKAILTLTTENHKFEIETSCSQDGQASYKITSFTKDDKPAKFAATIQEMGGEYGRLISFSYRLDKQPAQRGYTFKPRFSNELSLFPLPSAETGDVLAAKKVLVAVQVDGGDDLIEVDQTEGFRQAMAGCVPVAVKPEPSPAPRTTTPAPAANADAVEQ